MKSKLNNKNSLLSYTCVAFCTSFFWIVLGPLTIFINNADDFTIDAISLLKHLSVSAGGIFLVVLLVTVILPEKLSNAFVRMLAFITFSSWIFSSFLYGDYGQLDGTPLNITPWDWLGYSQLAVLIVLFLTIVMIRINIVYKAVYFVFFVGAISSAIGISNLDKDTYKHIKTGFHSGMTEMSPQKNILHVVLDALQSDLFFAAIENDDSLRDKFDGFTFYSNTSSVYPTTEMSIPMMITGEIYRNQQPKKEFLSALRKQNLGVKKLEDLGYLLDAHTICKGLITPCTSISPKIIDQTSQLSEATQLLDIYIFKSTPDWLKSFIYNKGNWLFLSNSNINEYLKIVPVGLGHLIFTNFVEELHIAKDPTPRYKLFHSLVTHDPIRLDANCKIVPQEQFASLNRVEFVKCGINHFVHILDKLKALGIYDKTMIILSSDHGAGYNGGNFNKAFLESGISEKVVGLSSATLLIKPYNTRGKIRTSAAQASLRDIPQTILAANGINVENEHNEAFPARDILNMNPTDIRKREYLHYTWKHKYWREPKLPPITVYPINGNIKDPLSWPNSLSVPGELTCNQLLLFNKQLSDVKALYGLSGIEHWGRWTNSHTVKIVFNLNTTECFQNKLSLKLKGFVTSKNPTQHSEVLLNGTQIGEIIINLNEQNPREFIFNIPPGITKQGKMNILEFNITNPTSPNSVNAGSDTRLLGLGFESMVFQ